MSERMTPIPFPQLMEWLFAERSAHGAVFGVQKPFAMRSEKKLPLFRETLETPFGPAAGPNTQLAENIIAAYYAGARFFELKTVQKMDGEELAACINRPCILAEDEGYNCEWSTELTVPQAFDEYVKAWFALKLISRKWGLGDPCGFAFNMSVGYDLAGVKTEKLDRFIEGMKDASSTPIWQECKEYALSAFPEDADYIEAISPHICTGVTVSTLHGCPPEEIEAIASYLISEKKLNTFVKCNPTILGYAFARETLDSMGYDYIAFDDHHFREDLQYEDAVPMFHRLSALAAENGLEFGLKLSNTFPVDVAANELPSAEMYMSGRALYLLTIEMARRMAEEFGGKLRLSYSGGADQENIKALFEAGIWPITMATTILKPGGYARMTQIAETLTACEYKPFTQVDVEAVAALSRAARENAKYRKPVKPLPPRKLAETVPLLDCFTAPCKGGCPIGQDSPEYIELCGRGEYLAALRLITEKNPLPFITGTICAHHCMEKCTRNFYEESVQIRRAKLFAAEKGYGALMAELKTPERKPGAPKTAVIGGGPAGIAAAYFLAREGYPVTVFERAEKPGGIVENVIPAFRIPEEAIEKDVALAVRMGAEFVCGKPAPALAELSEAGFENIILAFGAEQPGTLGIEGNVLNVIDFLRRAKNAPETLSLGKNVAVVGGGNTAMDAARAAKRMGAERVTVVYRRTKKYMPADAEELALALADGVEFAELLAPTAHENGMLVCEQMQLGAPDASGRRAPVATGKTVSIPTDTVIAAVGEKPSPEAFAAYGVALDARGRAQASYPGGVFVAGDALRGPATVVEAIADARAAADAITGSSRKVNFPAGSHPGYGAALAKKGKLAFPCAESCDAERCLACNTVCETCVTVCPNRANVAVEVSGHAMRQIVHVDRLCNECGNCATFCPYSSRPYRDKFTLFTTEQDFADSENDGFLVLCKNCPRVRVRLRGEVADFDLSGDNALDRGIETLILSVIEKYAYML